MPNIPSDFRAIKLKLASPEKILEWSHGEVLKPETINYRTQRPEKDGLFSEKIFGPTKDWECYCGKYKRIRYKGVICDKCGVEVTRSLVRRERMGHITLAAPCTHIWFLRGVPSKIGLMLDLSVKDLERVIYFADYIITSVDEEAKEKEFIELEAEFKSKKKAIRKEYEKKILKLKQKSSRSKDLEKRILAVEEEKHKTLDKLENAYKKSKDELANIKKMKVIPEYDWRNLSAKYGHLFQARIGSEAIRMLLSEINLKKTIKELSSSLKSASAQTKKRIRRRLSLFKSLLKAKIRPEWTILTVLPVIPPDLRPMVQLDGGRYAASDLNDLYRRVINRNNRLKKLIELSAPEVICRNEKRMLQEAVDALIDNSARKGKAVAIGGQKRLLKSLADMLKGKQGRFRQNLLGKRVDYSGRSVIVIGPELKLSECGIPKVMALELFKPFVIHKLIKNEYAHNVRSAGKLIEEGRAEIWDMLEEVISDHKVFLNRAPTLHRLGIQAFQPVLIEGKAIQIHPMVCTAFNADFDGDQMAVHVPLTEQAKKEADEVIASTKNLLKPATGQPITTPTQDIVLGCYFLTQLKENAKGEGKVFSCPEEALLALNNQLIDVRSKIKVVMEDGRIIETSAGRLIFNQALPKKFGFVNKAMDKSSLSEIIGQVLEKYGREEVVKLVDKLKDIGFSWLTLSGLSWGMDDLVIPKEKERLLAEAKKEIEKIRQQYRSGLLTDRERYIRTIEVWASVKDKITDLAIKTLDKYGPVTYMVKSGARGSWPQIVQMTGMRGLMAAPSGKTIELPVKNSFKEGLGVLEYFISTHGARKGLTDTALRTANAGYLTRRLIDVAQDIVVAEEDCGDKEGIVITQKESEEQNDTLAERALGRCAAKSVVSPRTKKVIIRAGEFIDKKKAAQINKLGIEEIKIRSVLSCKSRKGICKKCYGWDLAYNEPVKLGEAVGIIAAQSIGEPGTQLTMRTFHTGGVAGERDITQGLPRVEELFEVRGVRNPALIAEFDGVVFIEENQNQRKILRIVSKEAIKDNYGEIKELKLKVKNKDKVERKQVLAVDLRKREIKARRAGVVKIEKGKLFILSEGPIEKKYTLPPDAIFWVKDGDEVFKGQQLTEGNVDLRQMFRICGREKTQKYILREVQKIYSSQGQDVNDKHVEVIIRQMFSRVRIIETGESDFLEGEIVDRFRYEDERQKLAAEGKEPPLAQDLLLGITKASLSTESFLSAASFQETARVLIDAAITGKRDDLTGLKENVIIGKLIPAGTGFSSH